MTDRPLRLAQLEPRFIRHERRDGKTFHRFVESIAEAQGIIFLCPKCFAKNGGPVGTHSVICWSRSRGVPDDVSPGPGRWALQGSGFEDLTLGADPPNRARSVLLTGGCAWHGFVTKGEVTT